MTIPTFAVVGHPNKGKSSIVATLAQDDSVQISPISGTTVRCRRYPMRADGQVLYELVDTPGFQRARRALEWMQAHTTSAAERPAVVREFVQVHKDTDLFQDECELLTPILDGAGILYVTDGSKPYGEEYEAEMEILRWTGRPSMALINMISDEDHVEEWRAALGQYFRIVRVFDALTAEFDKRLELLRAFGQLDETWREPLAKAVEYLDDDWQRRKHQSARIISDMLVDMFTVSVSKKLPSGANAKDYEELLKQKLFAELRKTERSCRNKIESIYAYHDLQRIEDEFETVEEDLFSRQTWSAFGLTRSQLLATGALGGAAAGSVIDVATGGASLLAGAGIGALVGGISAVISFDKIAEIKLLGLPLGGFEAKAGPVRNINFPYVVTARAVHHHRMVAARTHAQRDELDMTSAPDNTGASAFDASQRKVLAKVFSAIRDSEPDGVSQRHVDKLNTVIEQLLDRG